MVAPRDELLAVCRQVLDDPARGEADLMRIGASGPPDELLRVVARLLPEVPDPDLALVHLERYCREGQAPADPERLSVLFTLLSYSPYLAEAILNDRAYLADLVRARRQEAWGTAEYRDALARWLRIAHTEDPWDALRSFKRRVNMRIAVRDLERRAAFPEIGAEISHAADALIEVALDMAMREMVSAHGRPQAFDDAGRTVEATLSVISLGKLGGGELNYSSDIDLLFLYTRDGETTGAPGRPDTQIGNKEFFTRMAEVLSQGLRHISTEGQVFRVDCRLRPGGRDGDLVIPLEAAIAYYRTWARPWEIQALIKARHSAGDPALAGRFLAGLEPIVYPGTADRVAADSVREMKDRIDAEQARRGIAAFHLKLGRGGIREIEFTAQALQLVHGGREPWVRESNTLLALHRLTDKGLLSVTEYGALTAAYVFLREAEHRLQLHRNLQRSVVPTPSRDRRVLARSLGYRDGAHRREAALFDADLERHREMVRSIYDAVLARLSQGSLQDTAVFDPFLDAMPDSAVAARLEAHGVADPHALLGSVQSIARLLVSPAAPAGARRAFRHVTPVLLRELAGVHGRVRALRSLERFLSSMALEQGRLEALFERRELFGPLVRLFAGSQMLSSVLIHRPTLVLEPGFDAAIARERTVDEHVSFLEVAIRGAASEDDRDARLRIYQRTQLLYIGLRDLSRQMRPSAVQRALSSLAEALVRVCVAASARAAGWATGDRTETPGFLVLGLGKMGYGEMDYASDLDLVFLYEAGDEESGSRHAAANQVARHAVEMLTSITREGALYSVDTRLRPFGTEGELAQPIERAAPYLASTAAIWELQSYLKARPVGGDLSLGEAVGARLEAAILDRARREELAPAVKEMRERLRPAENPALPRIDIKRGEGGLASIQFAIQYLQLRHGIPSPPFKRTTRVLATLRSAGALDDRAYHAFFTGFQFLRRLEHHLRVLHGRAVSCLPDSVEALDELAAAMGYRVNARVAPRERLMASLARHRRRIESSWRGVIEQVPDPHGFS